MTVSEDGPLPLAAGGYTCHLLTINIQKAALQGKLNFAILPPSIVQTWPVTNEASSLASQQISAATSSDEPVRPTG